MKRHRLLWIVLIVLSLVGLSGEWGPTGQAAPLAVAPGDFDASFGFNGYAITPFNQGPSGAYAIAFWETGGKIVVAGAVETTWHGEDVAIARYHLDGTLDTGFGNGGRVTTTISDQDDRAHDLAVTANGEIIVGGYTQQNGGDFFLAKYAYDGSLKTDFGSGGIVRTDFSGGYDVLRGLALQPDGKIVAAGQAEVSPSCPYFALARYQSDGSLDTSFSGDGKLTTQVSAGACGFAYDVALQSDGKIVAGGGVQAVTGLNFALARYQSNGNLDMSFSGDGKVTTSFSAYEDYIQEIAIQSDGKIVAAGIGSYNSYFALARYQTNGSLDTGFSGDGKVTTTIGSANYAYSLALQDNGKILVGGSVVEGTQEDLVLFRYTSSGSPDTGFGVNGAVIKNLYQLDAIRAMKLQADGKILAAGYSGGASDLDLMAARFHGDGTQNPTGTLYGSINEPHVVSMVGCPDVAIRVDGVYKGQTGFYGNFNLPLMPGTYDLNFTKPGYHPINRSDIDIFPYEKTQVSYNMISEECWSPGQVCLNEVLNVIPFIGIPSEVSGAANTWCEINRRLEEGDEAAGHYLTLMGIIDLIDIPVTADLTVDVVEGLIACLESVLYEQYQNDLVTLDVQRQFTIDLWRFNPIDRRSLMLLIHTPTAARQPESAFPYEVHFYQGGQHLGLNGGSVEHEIPDSYLFQLGDGYQLAIINQAVGEYDLVIEGLAAAAQPLMLIHPRPDGGANLVTFDSLSVTGASQAALHLSPGMTDYQLAIDWDGNGTPDDVQDPDATRLLVVETRFLPAVLFGGDNLTPDLPSNPSPEDGAVDASNDLTLGWQGQDPDGDALIYDVYLAPYNSAPETLVCSNLTSPACDPGTLAYDTTYYWKVESRDPSGARAQSLVWQFTTESDPNQPPNTPSNPTPGHQTTGQGTSLSLGWSGGDPLGETVTYTVYLDAFDPSPQTVVCQDGTAASCNPGALANHQKYFWQVVATDAVGQQTAGPVWSFVTGAAGWYPVGSGSSNWLGTGDTVCDYAYSRSSIDIDNEGVPYVAWDCDIEQTDSEIYVRRWKDNHWEEVGTNSGNHGGISNNSGESTKPIIALDSTGHPYVTWQDEYNGGNEIYIRYWNGVDWVQLGSGSASGGGISQINYSIDIIFSMDVSDQDIAYVGIYPGNTGVKYWNGNIWQISDPFSPLTVAANSQNGVQAIYSLTGQYYAANWADNEWQTLGSSIGTGQDPKIDVGSQGISYTTWTSNGEVYVKGWNGSSWQEIGDQSGTYGGISNLPTSSLHPDIQISPDGTPVVAWYEIVDHVEQIWEIYIRKWHNNEWVEVGNGSATGYGVSNSLMPSAYPNIGIGPDGTIYLVWKDYLVINDSLHGWEVRVYRYLGY